MNQYTPLTYGLGIIYNVTNVKFLLLMNAEQPEINWSSELAYAVGLITTDGNLSPDGRHIDFTSKDLELIKTFKKCLKLENKIGTKKNGLRQPSTAFRVQFGNVSLYRWLIQIGLTPKKSKVVGKIAIPNELFFDFLRGFLDGDGTILRYFDPVYPKSLRLYVKFISASPAHLEWLQSKIKTLAHIKGFIKKCGNKVVQELVYSKYDSIKLLNYMYYKDNLPLLKRKFEIAKEFIN